MENELVIDVRKYVLTLLHHWKWIVGVAVLAALAGYLLSTMGSTVYESTAMVAVSKPRYLLNFDPRFEAQTVQTPNYKAYLDMGTSQEILAALIAAWPDKPADIVYVQDIEPLVKIESGSDPSVFILTVTYKDRNQAAELANLWAGLFIDKVKVVYSGLGPEQVSFYESQLSDAQTSFDKAQQDLVNFEAQNTKNIDQNSLDALMSNQTSLLRRVNNIQSIIKDIDALRSQISQSTVQTNAKYEDQVNLLLLQIRAFNENYSTNLQLQLGATATDGFATATPEEQIAYLDQLKQILSDQSMALQDSIKAMDPEILTLQQKVQAAQTEEDRLKLVSSLSQETYTALSRKVNETKISNADDSSDVSLASQAIPPQLPVSSHKARNTVIGGVFGGLMVGLFFLLKMWWESPDQ